MDILASSPTADREHQRNLLETSESRVSALEGAFINFCTDVNELASMKSSLDDVVIVAETRLKDVDDVRNVRSSHLHDLRTESTFIRHQ